MSARPVLFLYTLTQAQLAGVCFPVGGMNKEETRAFAARLGLRVHDKKESQNICFAAGCGYRDFIRRQAGDRIGPGPIIDERGVAVGEHGGLSFYAVGRRWGIGISAPERVYVCDVDAASNMVRVTCSRKDLLRRGILLDDVRLVRGDGFERTVRVPARTWYRGPEWPATLLPLYGGGATLEFDQPLEAPAPGQAAAFYDGDEVIGGGVARRSLS